MTLELIKGNSPFLHPPRNCCFHSAEPTAWVNSFMLQKCRYELAYGPVNRRHQSALLDPGLIHNCHEQLQNVKNERKRTALLFLAFTSVVSIWISRPAINKPHLNAVHTLEQRIKAPAPHPEGRTTHTGHCSLNVTWKLQTAKPRIL